MRASSIGRVKKQFSVWLSLCLLLCVASKVFAAPLYFKIEIQGINGAVLKNVDVRLQQARLYANLDNAQQVKEFHALAPAQIRFALQAYGFFKPRIQSRLVRQDSTWQGIYRIDAGEPLKVNQVQLSITGPGQQLPALQGLRAHFPLKPGSILLTEEYNTAKKSWLETAEKLGFLHANFVQHEIKVDLTRYTATILLRFDTGPRYQFGDIHFAKNPLKTSFLKRYVHFKTNDVYSSKHLLDLQDALNSSGYFQRVAVIPERDDLQNTRVPIRVELVPRKSQQYNFGIGYGTDTGIRGSLGWEWRRVTDTGHRFSAQMTASQIQNSLLAQYTIPGHDPTTDQYNAKASIQNYQYRQGESHVQQVGASYSSAHEGWQWSGFINYQRERFHLTTEPYTTSYLLIPGINTLRIKSDKALNPNSGYKLSLNLQGASDALLSSTRFIQITAQGKVIQALTDNSWIIARSDLGFTSVHDLNLLPLSLRFYAGGAQSVRGYAYQSLGPGRYLVTGSLEYQHRLKGNWNWAGFYDVGNAVDDFAAPRISGYSGFLQRGAGLGIVWHSPVGALQLNFAKALSKEGQPWQIQFSMGPEL